MSKRGRSGTPRRSRRKRPVLKRVLIVGEGRQTEPNYFDGLKRQDAAVRQRFSVTVKAGQGKSPEDVIDQAVRLQEQEHRKGEAFDEVWCVLDTEGAEVLESLDRALAAAREHDITVCLSNPCFEVWIRAHFVRSRREFPNCAAVIEELNRTWESEFGQSYQKNDRDLYEKLRERLDDAVANAEAVLEKDHDAENCGDVTKCNSSTDVYKLARHLTGHDDQAT